MPRCSFIITHIGRLPCVGQRSFTISTLTPRAVDMLLRGLVWSLTCRVLDESTVYRLFLRHHQWRCHFLEDYRCQSLWALLRTRTGKKVLLVLIELRLVQRSSYIRSDGGFARILSIFSMARAGPYARLGVKPATRVHRRPRRTVIHKPGTMVVRIPTDHTHLPHGPKAAAAGPYSRRSGV